MRYQKFMLAPAAAGAALILSSAQSARADFSGPYAPSNWTLSNTTVTGSSGNPVTGNGFATTATAPISITVTGSNGSGTIPGPGPDIYTFYTITAAASGTWSFNWAYACTDSSEYDGAAYVLNGGFITLATSNGESGSVSIGVNAGDTIGFRMFTVDNNNGPGNLTVTNFNAPVPAPGALALLGMAGLVGSRRRRRT